MKNSGYQALEVWRKSMLLVKVIYRITKFLPAEELYGLTNQMRRAAVSIPSNIAEGEARYSKREFCKFLHIAQGSRAELETQLMICVALEYAEKTQIEPAMRLCDEIGKMLAAMLRTLEKE